MNTWARVIEHDPLGEKLFRLRLRAPKIAEAAQPGQFVMLKVRHGKDPVLARPFSIHGVEPSELWAAISPSLGPCCSEFVNHAAELPPDWGLYSIRPDHFDLWQVTWDQLTTAGVPMQNIETSGICTKCSPKFYSYRREGVTGRFGTVVALTPEAS